MKGPIWADTALGRFFLLVGGVLALVWVVLLAYAIVADRWEALGD